MAAKQRNGMIDMMRFVLTCSVVMIHLITGYLQERIAFLRGGTIAVEFFFVLSGFLLASSADRADKSQPLWQATWKTMKGKVCGIWPVWIVALGARMVTKIITGNMGVNKIIRMVEESTSGYLMLTQLGLVDNAVIKFSWYIPVMLLCTLALYPVLSKQRKNFTYTLAPLIAIFGCTYLFHTFGKLFTLQKQWLGFTWGATVRGLCEMCLGVVAYEASMWMKTRFSGKLTKTGRTFFTVLELGVLAYPMYYVVTRLRSEVMLGILLCFAAFIAIAFTNLSWTAEVIKGRFWGWLGKFSLALYLAQGVPSELLRGFYASHPDMRMRYFIVIYFAVAFVAAFMIHYCAQLLIFVSRKVKAGLLKASVAEEN